MAVCKHLLQIRVRQFRCVDIRIGIRQSLLTLAGPPPRSAKFPALTGWGIHLVLVALAKGCLSPEPV